MAGSRGSLELAVGGEFLAADDGVERLAVAAGGGTSSDAAGGQTFLVDGGGEPFAVERGEETPGLAMLLVAAGREAWSAPHGGGASESGGPTEL